MAIGYDPGTYHLVVARRNTEGKVECNKQVNAFVEIPLDDPFTYNMLEKNKVPLINRGTHAFAVGDKAVSIARTFNSLLRRPMKSGCVNPFEKDSFNVLGTMIHKMMGEIANDGESLVYSIPADAINQETDIAHHREVLKMIFDKYSVNGKKVHAYPINEGLALVYAELQDKFMTGFGISFGAGMTNLCFANQSRPVFQFSIVNAGDWIDQQAAKASATTETIVNKEKEKINLLADPKNEIERAIQIQYRIMISNTVKGIKEGIEKVGRNRLPDEPVDFVLSGGTSSPPGFDVLFKQAVAEQGLPVPIGEIKHPMDHLYAVARGCLEAAEASEI
jgi:hypothetical protein